MNTNHARASQVIERIVGGWRGAPPVTLVAWPQDLPISGAPSDVRGLYMNGSTWIVANTQSPSKVAETLAHEALGHHTMYDMLGAKWASFMYALNSGARAGDTKLAGMRDRVRSIYVDDRGKCNLSALEVSNELAAAVVEYRFDGATGRLAVDRPARKLAQAAAGHLSREVLYIDRPATFDELEGTLLAAEHKLRFGGAFWGIAFHVKRLYAATMSKPWNPRTPPMSLSESESLLKAEKYRRDSLEEWKTIGMMAVGFLLFLVVVAGAISLVIDLFHGFRR